MSNPVPPVPNSVQGAGPGGVPAMNGAIVNTTTVTFNTPVIDPRDLCCCGAFHITVGARIVAWFHIIVGSLCAIILAFVLLLDLSGGYMNGTTLKIYPIAILACIVSVVCAWWVLKAILNTKKQGVIPFMVIEVLGMVLNLVSMNWLAIPFNVWFLFVMYQCYLYIERCEASGTSSAFQTMGKGAQVVVQNTYAAQQPVVNVQPVTLNATTTAPTVHPNAVPTMTPRAPAADSDYKQAPPPAYNEAVAADQEKY